MPLRRRPPVLGALLAAALACATAARAAAVSKLDARLRSRRAPSYAPAGAGAAGGGPRHPVLIRVTPGTPLASLRAAFPQAEFGTQAGDVITARADDSALDALAGDARVRAIDGGVFAHPVMDVIRSSSTNGGLALGTIYGAAATDLAGATGAGVIVGVVDTGIDYTHKDFINDGANTSRILYIWDQTISSHSGGPFPSSYGYGAEYTNAQLTAKIQGGGGTINTADTDGHGTHVASIAAGDGTDTNGLLPAGTFVGMAPSADIVFVRTTFNTADIVDAVNYIVAKAAAAGKRAVVNLSLGTQSGPHDGTSTFESSLGSIAATTPIVVALGNDGSAKPHAGVNVGVGGSAGVTVNVDAATDDADVQFWLPSADAYSATVALSGVSGTLVTASGSDGSTTLGGHTVQIYNATNTGHPQGDKQIYVYVHRAGGITAPSISVTLARTASGGSGRLDGWVEPAQGISFGSYIDNTRTLGEPSCAQNVFGVASYASKEYWTSGDGFTYHFTDQSSLGAFSAFSSQGPTRDGRQQPEVAAPGDVVAGAKSAGSSPAAALVLADAKHRILRGTSMATPVVAGILAARLQWGSTRTVSDLRAILRAQARGDGATGTVPNYAWGYGKVASSPQPVSPPTGLTAATLGVSSISWSWSSVTGADGYTLYYATNPTVSLGSVALPPYVQTGLAANTTTGLLIKGAGAGVAGAGAFISTSTLAAPPAALPAVAPHVDSATLTWTPCPASPPASSCAGYSVAASTAADGSGTALSAQTLNRADSSLAVTGLQPLTTYYFRLSTLNLYGAASSTGAVAAVTLTDILAPVSPQFSEATASSVRFDWNGAGNAAGTVYVAQASTSPSFAGTAASSSTRNTFAVLSGLATNASYYFRVQATSGPFLAPASPVPTLAAPPAASTTPYLGVSQSGFTVAWSSGGNTAGTLYRAELSPSANFVPVTASSTTRNQYAAFGGLVPNTLYYARALAVSHGGVSTAYATLGSTPTFVYAPVLPGQPFSGQSADGFTFAFNDGGNPPGTVYDVRVSTDPVFATLTRRVSVTTSPVVFSGLDSNRLYYADAAALNLSGAPSAYTAAASTATTVTAPGAAAATVTTRSVSGLTAAWTAGTLGPGTVFTVQASLAPGFSPVAASSATLNPYAALTGLSANASYYLRVRAASLNPPTPDGPWTSLGSASTLAGLPGAAATPFPLVGVASVTVAWTALPLSPPAAAAEGYRAELSENAAFTGVVRSSVVAPGAAAATFEGLSYGTVYYARVGSLDWEGNPNYLLIGSTRTAAPELSSGAVTGGSLTLTLSGAFPVAPGVSAEIQSGTFPPGTVVTMISGVTLDLSNPPSSVARLTALGSSVGIDISAGGLQPLKPVRLVMRYDPLLLPPGADPRRLVIARYDEASGLWTVVPTAVDASAHLIVATLDHFSAYAPFLAAAGAGLADGVVYPQPWEAGASGGAYSAQALTFASYPDGTRIRLMSLTGELVWEGVTAASGVLTWDGRNRHGRAVASGTYYALIEGGGAKTVRRVVVIR